MYKCLAPVEMGVFCSQSELIELTLTHGFKGWHIDFDSFFEQVTEKGIETATRYLKSAPIKIASTRLPIEWWGDDESFEAELIRLPKILEQIKPIACQAMLTNVMPGCHVRAYHENFEMHRQRLPRIADVLAAAEMRLAINFAIPLADDEQFANSFITEPEAFITLLKTTDSPNLSIVVDAWRWTLAGGSFDLLSDLSAEQIVDVRVADLPADWNPNRTTEKDRLHYGETGAVSGGALHEVLANLGYKGSVTPWADSEQYAELRSDAAVRRAAESIERFLDPNKFTAQPADETSEEAEVSCGSESS